MDMPMFFWARRLWCGCVGHEWVALPTGQLQCTRCWRMVEGPIWGLLFAGYEPPAGAALFISNPVLFIGNRAWPNYLNNCGKPSESANSLTLLRCLPQGS